MLKITFEKLASQIAQMATQTTKFQEEVGITQKKKNTPALIEYIEMKFGQIAKKISQTPQGIFPSTTMTNPREYKHINAITKRRQKDVEEQLSKIDNKIRVKQTPNLIERELQILEPNENENHVEDQPTMYDNEKFSNLEIRVHYPKRPKKPKD